MNNVGQVVWIVVLSTVVTVCALISLLCTACGVYGMFIGLGQVARGGAATSFFMLLISLPFITGFGWLAWWGAGKIKLELAALRGEIPPASTPLSVIPPSEKSPHD